MLKSINQAYLLVSVILYFILSPKISGEYILINLFVMLSVITYFTVLYTNIDINLKSYTKTYLSTEVFLYSLLFVAMENSISYFYSNNFFMFSMSDAVTYHKSTIEILNKPLLEAIDQYLTHMGFDDLGMILVLYPIYHIYPSNITLNIFYLLVTVITTVGIFELAKNFMSDKYAFLASLSYSLSSFVLLFNATGLKESFMIMLVVLSFKYYYSLNKKLSSSIAFLSTIISLLFFRPALAVMIIGVIGLSSILSNKGSIGKKIFAFLIFLFLIAMSNSILAEIESYTTGGMDTLVEARDMKGSSVSFAYIVHILSQAIGPIPTLISSEKILTMFYAPGLIYRILLAFPFWLAIFYIYKTRDYKLYPLVFFVLMEMSSLAFILDGLELRKSMPHIPFVFVIAFWFLDKYDNRVLRIKKRKRFNQFFKFSMFIFVLLIFYWNFR